MYAKRRDLEGPPWNLPKAKADALCAKTQCWQWDPDFPNDEEEQLYWVRKAITGKRIKRISDQMTVEGSQYLDEGQARQLLDDGGIFGDIGTMELQAEAELDKAEGAPRSKAKSRTKASSSGATDREEVAVVQTPKELAAATMSKILKEITEAKEYDIKIQGSPSPFAMDVCKSLQGYIARQEELYQQFKGCNFETDM